MSQRDLVNTFVIRSGLQPIYNLPITFGLEIVNNGVLFGEGSSIRLDRTAQPRILTDKGRVLRAMAQKRPAGCHTLIGAPLDHGSILVHIIRKDLKFNLRPLADDLNLWPGGDAEFFPILQTGDDKSPSKHQLYEIKDNHYIFVIDEMMNIIKLMCLAGKPIIFPVEEHELATFMLDRALGIRTPWALDWAIYNTQALMRKHGSGDVQLNSNYVRLNQAREAA